VYLVEKPDTAEKNLIIKFTPLGLKGSKHYEEKLKLIRCDMAINNTVNKNNPYLMQYVEVFEERGYYCIVMEYCSRGSLQSVLDNGKIFNEEVFCFNL
jgi:serine/threonine protein kinase